MSDFGHIDIKGWQKKAWNVKKVEAAAVAVAVSWGLDLLHKTAVKNVSGPRYGFRKGTGKDGDNVRIPQRGPLTNAGMLPVPVVYGMLRRSIKSVRISSVLGAVYADENIAYYAPFVHDGTRYMKPRRFLQDAVTGMRPIIKRKMDKELKAAIRSVGRI